MRVRCIATIDMPTASAAAHGAGPHSLTMSTPTRVETRWPPMSARGWAGSVWGEPRTKTIDVANGMAISGTLTQLVRPRTAKRPRRKLFAIAGADGGGEAGNFARGAREAQRLLGIAAPTNSR